MSSSEREAVYSGVSCEKCGLVLETSSKAEKHRLEAHTPKGVLDFFYRVTYSDKRKRGFTVDYKTGKINQCKVTIDSENGVVFHD